MKRTILNICGICCLSAILSAQPVERFIITDQFGYLPDAEKIAVIKDPETGFDADRSFIPGNKYLVINAFNDAHVYRGQPVVWNSGNTDESSGDKIWHFDFSEVSDTGHYYILDSVNMVRSYEFIISTDVYREVLRHAVRAFFYQRAGFEKESRYAGEGWADGASHIGPLQDKNCRPYNNKTNAAMERDLSGGWYDAGDYNKYSNWTANYVVEMMKAFIENPGAWGDDCNIPESGNGIPDLLDEAKWGIDHLLRMQEDHGGVLCIVSESHASPPSSATGQSVYAPATTSASLNTAAALAISARVFRYINRKQYADSLIQAAENAWNWAVTNPAVVFHNNSAGNNSLGVGAGDQETNDYGRLMAKLEAACFLFEVTEKSDYQIFFDNNYQSTDLIQWNYAYPYEPAEQDVLLYYTLIPGASIPVVSQIKSIYRNAMLNNADNFPARYSVKDPYMAHLNTYTWGSNNQKGAQGSMYYNIIQFEIDASKNSDALKAAAGYIHYLHGVNPLNLVYLSNMYKFGGDSCVNEFYHSWFANGSAKWDRFGTSLYGPPPGFVTGGPNPSYNRAPCCETNDCGSAENNAICASESLSPPKDQPKQKSYKDFNTSWPLNSWEVTENSGGYQVSYIRLLSKFVNGYDCHGDWAGTAEYDLCGICSGGNTGRVPAAATCNCPGETQADIVQSGDTLTAVQEGMAYRWLQCDDQYTPVEGANGISFTPLLSGSYALEITNAGCADTSQCVTIEITGLQVNELGPDLMVYPNPVNDLLKIRLPAAYEELDIQLRNLTGQLILSKQYRNMKNISIPLKYPAGVYMLSLHNNLNQSALIKVLIE